MEELLQDIEKDFGPKFDALTERASDITERLEAGPSDEDQKALTKQLEDLDSQVKTLTAERDERLRDAEKKAMVGRLESLEQTLEAAREPHSAFSIAKGVSEEDQKALYGRNEKGERETSFYGDAKAVLDGSDPEARERWLESLDGKAMTEGTGSAGGFLVPDQISDELLELRVQRSVLRGLFSSIQVTSDTLRIASVTGGLTAGWVAELATKPQADLTFGEISANVFTAAGLAVASNQLLADARRSVDSLVNSDLALRLANLEEIAFINGTGTGQPQGILGTSGINSVALTLTTIPALVDAIQDAITAIYTNYFGAPNAIVMHPRTWARIVKDRDSNGQYTYQSGDFYSRTSADPLPGYGSGQTPRGNLFGLPVYTTANIPTNLGAGTNESRVIVANFNEGLILDREGITLDQSKHVYFTSNQTVFRAEERLGFTAARYPKAFSVVGGAGLANG